MDHLLYAKDEFFFADVGYQCAEKSKELADMKAELAIAMRPGKLKGLKKHLHKNKAVIACENAQVKHSSQGAPLSDSSHVSLAL